MHGNELGSITRIRDQLVIRLLLPNSSSWRLLSFPIWSVEGAIFVDALIRVGAEVVALGLDEVGREAFGGVGLQIIQRRGGGHAWDVGGRSEMDKSL